MKALDLIKIGSNKLKENNIFSYNLESEILLSNVLKTTREKVLVNLDNKISNLKKKKYIELIQRRSLKEPIAYILEEKEFWSKKFKVNNNTLIPRPETELIVENLVKNSKHKKINILDIGTGCGCILISLLSELKNSHGTGIDISKKALEIAKENARLHLVNTRIRFINKSFEKLFNYKFDLIVSNPPYIEKPFIKNLHEDIKNFEPKIALDGGNDGLDVIKKVIYKSKDILKINGTLALEIGNEQNFEVSKILYNNRFKIVQKIKDLNDNTRCIISKLKSKY